MPLTNGLHHVAVVTADLDRFIDFYIEAFDAEVAAFLAEGDLRHALVDVGGGRFLHPFEVPGTDGAGGGPIFGRGHLDHLALAVDDADALETVRRRLVDLGASDGTVTDFGLVAGVSFTDPDGMEGEVSFTSTGAVLAFDQRRQIAYPAPVAS